MFWRKPKSHGQKVWMSASLTSLTVQIHHGHCFKGVYMQKQVLQSKYFWNESLPSSFQFYSPLMDLRQTLFLFLEARQEKMERTHEDVS